MQPNLEEERFKQTFHLTILFLMFFILVLGLLTLSSCTAIPEIMKTADDVFDDAIKVNIDKTAIQERVDFTLTFEVKARDHK